MNPNPDLENLEITFPCASPAPYMRESEMGVYYECLQCNEQSVHLERLNGGASMLRNHNPATKRKRKFIFDRFRL